MTTYDTQTIQPEGREIEVSREETCRADQPCEGTGSTQRKKRVPEIPTLTELEKERFFAKISTTPTDLGCLEWAASINGKGYGQIRIFGKTFAAHRVAYSLYYGTDPSGLHVLHSCDNPSCCFGGHLFLGTNADNVADKVRKGRAKGMPGVLNSKAKLTETDVSEIRRLRASGMIARCIAEQFNVGRSMVSHITNRRFWKHVS